MSNNNIEQAIAKKTGISLKDIKFAKSEDNFHALIDVSDIRVDFYQGDNQNYQRQLDKKNLNNIVKNYDEDLFDAPVLAIREDGTIHCPDGSHRIHALMELGHEKVLARCFMSKGFEHEAYVFSKGNSGRKPISKTDAFIANVAMGSEVEVAVDALLKKYNLLSNSRGCINLIMYSYKMNDAILTANNQSKTSFEWMLDVLSNDLKADKKYFIEAIIGGLSSFLNLVTSYPKIAKSFDMEIFRAYIKSLYSISNLEEFKSELSRKIHAHAIRTKKTQHPQMRREVACWTHQYMFNRYIKKNRIDSKFINLVSVNLELKKELCQ